MKDTLIMKQPAAFFGQLWREATPIGNGFTGALVYGGVKCENVLFNRFDLWHGGRDSEDIPDVSKSFYDMRKLMDEGKYYDSCVFLCDELKQKGYECKTSVPDCLGMLKIEISSGAVFSNYRRYLHMDKGECEISYAEGENRISRKCFLSRSGDVFVYEAKSDTDKEFEISFNLHNDYTDATERKKEEIEGKLKTEYDGEYIFFTVNDGEDSYGAVVKAIGAKAERGRLFVSSKNLNLLVKCFSKVNGINKDFMKNQIDAFRFDYVKLLEEHNEIHKKLYKSAEISFCEEDDNLTNEELLDMVYEDKAPNALIEKLWKFGRYLFISSTEENNGLPVPLYGLWHGEYEAIFSQNVANENVEMIYWHILTGNLSAFMVPLIKYYHKNIEMYKEYARKFFGCRGIYIGVYSTPECTRIHQTVPVILHYISAAGWLCQHFYNYYKMTNDKAVLKEYILPFMIETALFYEDYACYENGKMKIYPSVSPENSPGEFVDGDAALTLPMPVVKNSTMDFAVLKELLTNLIALSEDSSNEIKEEQLKTWKKMLSSIPEYMVGEDGAIKEWMSDEFSENYFHRHLSHIYPLFPGCEIDDENALRENFKTAVENRIIQACSGWSFPHMAGIYSVLGQADKVINSIDVLCKGCLMKNFMTLHNDYRSMGVALEADNFAPVQLDALFGTVNTIQMMLLQYDDKKIKIMPALSERLDYVKAKNLAFYGGMVDIFRKGENVIVKISASCDIKRKIALPESDFGYLVKQNNETTMYDKNKVYNIKQGENLEIYINSERK